MASAATSQAAAVTPAGPPIPASAVATPAAVTGPTVPPPSHQVLSVVAPLVYGSDGSHQISLQLRPEGLGTVDATVTLRGAHVTVELRTDTAGAQQVLGAALPQLRQELAGRSGQGATVLLSQGDTGRQQQAPPVWRAGGRAALTDAGPEPAGPARLITSRSSSIDLRL